VGWERGVLGDIISVNEELSRGSRFTLGDCF
jgi:hypothetical protein